MIIVLLQNDCNFKRTLYSCKVDINNYSIESNPKVIGNSRELVDLK